MTSLLTVKNFNPIVPPVTTPWVYHDATLWVISVSSDWQNRITISDKNEWASACRTWKVTQTRETCWRLFQWWNNTGFEYLSNSPVDDTNTIDTTWYGPGNYYVWADNTFINVNPDRSSVDNGDLWWWETDTVEARQWPCVSWFHVPSQQEYTNLVTVMNTLGTTIWWQYLLMPTTWFRYASTGWSSTHIWIWTLSYYWTSDTDVQWTAVVACIYDDDWNDWGFTTVNRSTWCNLRAFKNIPIQPNMDWTVLYQTN